MRSSLSVSSIVCGLREIYSESECKRLISHAGNFGYFSEYALILKAKQSDFDSAIRRFESSRPSQFFVFMCSYLVSDPFFTQLHSER